MLDILIGLMRSRTTKPRRTDGWELWDKYRPGLVLRKTADSVSLSEREFLEGFCGGGMSYGQRLEGVLL